MQCNVGLKFSTSNSTDHNVRCTSDGRWDLPVGECLGICLTFNLL